MEAYQQRVLDELNELEVRRVKLNQFLDSDNTYGVNPSQLSLMKIQSQIMLAYSQVLRERINLF